MPTISDYLTDLSKTRDLLVTHLYEGGAITQTEYKKYFDRSNVLSLSYYISRVDNYKKFTRTYATKAATPTTYKIPNYAFESCSNLNEIKIPEGVLEIGIGAFMFCNSLSEITIPSTVVAIGSQAFYSCSNLTKVTFKGTPQNLYNNIFSNCSKLTNIYVPWTKYQVINAPWGATNATIHYNAEV